MVVKEVVSVYDIQPYFDSYVHDIEQNLQMPGTDDWKKYEKDPRPYILDMLGDFAEPGWSEEEIKAAVNRHYDWVNKN